MPSPSSKPPISPEKLALALGHKTRWYVLAELLKGEPLPVNELSKRVGVKAANLAKHVAILRQAGIVERGYGKLNRISSRFLPQGERAIDLGLVLLRVESLGK